MLVRGTLYESTGHGNQLVETRFHAIARLFLLILSRLNSHLVEMVKMVIALVWFNIIILLAHRRLNLGTDFLGFALFFKNGSYVGDAIVGVHFDLCVS